MDAILVFDEAESLFGSRSDSMSSSTDRQARIRRISICSKPQNQAIGLH